ncbi:hypothetical protein PROFUN_11335 [Planoprotostelium fungivorum]|uniref:Uncharacterized protein n=1 Tax=Planoprotostelium fungivorum TaxID=1890364 RepID=A0A2P6NAB0_9EUKA|nr:hypothetical protein PROFUN_11335 [Planoprotostelium fungivorum]
MTTTERHNQGNCILSGTTVKLKDFLNKNSPGCGATEFIFYTRVQEIQQEEVARILRKAEMRADR